LSEEDLQDLQNGKSFEWSFPDQNWVWIDVIVTTEPEEEEEEEEDFRPVSGGFVPEDLDPEN
jgi:hypothetical protein